MGPNRQTGEGGLAVDDPHFIIRRARSRAGGPVPWSPAGFSWLCSRVKEQISALGAAIVAFWFPESYYNPVEFQMAA
jgi:hypothetical protein